jgi:hypothetical protein
MALSLGDLSVLAYANGFTLWHYKSAQTLETLAIPGYFNAAADRLASGDMMMVSARDGGRMVCIAAGDGSVALAPLG